MSDSGFSKVKESFDEIATACTQNLERVIAIDSQSDEQSSSVPSTDGQKEISADLARFFDSLGYEYSTDEAANLLVTVPANDPQRTVVTALMAHMDTSKGTRAVPHLSVVSKWPDEEIGRMQAIQAVAEEFVQRKVRYGYTIDGFLPFEINIENFNASQGELTIHSSPLVLTAKRCKALSIRLVGVKSHGATAKSEGHINSLLFVYQLFNSLNPDSGIVLTGAATDPDAEVEGSYEISLFGDSDDDLEVKKGTLLGRIESIVEHHTWRGAGWNLMSEKDVSLTSHEINDGGIKILSHLVQFFKFSNGPKPLLSEESDRYQGYSNPFSLICAGKTWKLKYRIRDFTTEGLKAREEHVRTCASGEGYLVSFTPQYINMGPVLAKYPELVRWAEKAAIPLGRESVKHPIRGGTGVDPFLEKNIPVANLGTGYFGLESPKEFTSKQYLALHTLWLVNLAQAVGRD